MKKVFRTPVILLILVFLAACMKNEFSISFKFPGDHVGNYIVNYYAWNSKKGTWIETVASVQNGTASVQASTVRPTIVYIRDASSPSNNIALYAERGDEIIISGDNPDMTTWSVKGNRLSELWAEWRRRNASILSASRDSLSSAKKKAISDFVKGNKDNSLSAILLLTEWSRRDDSDGFVKLWNSIDKDAIPQEIVEMCATPDLLGVSFTVKADGSLEAAKSGLPGNLVLRTRDNGIDTLRFGKKRPAFLFFYADNNSRRNEVGDSLRAVADQYPDSAKRIISMLSLHPDSMAWINSTRRDTIKGLVRAWIPRGVADPAMISLGVTRIPWFVVIAPDGRESYSGSDLHSAIRSFRSLLGSPQDSRVAPTKKQPN